MMMNQVKKTFGEAPSLKNSEVFFSPTVEFWKVALTIVKEESNRWGVFLLFLKIAPLLLH